MGKLTPEIDQAQQLLADSIKRMDEAETKIRSLDGNADKADERDLHKSLFDKYAEEARERTETVERLIAVQDARDKIPGVTTEDDATEEKRNFRTVSTEEPHTYRKDNAGELSFFADMVSFKIHGDPAAGGRLARHQLETRDVTTADPGAGVFLPPQYMSNLLAELPRESRPFADALPKLPLPDTGIALTVPRVTTGTSTAAQTAENAAVSETDIDGTLLTVDVVTIAGQNDVSLRALERTMPGMDFLIFKDLTEDFDETLDQQCIAGTAANGQHRGIRAVSSVNTVAFTTGSPTAALLVPKIYDAIQKVNTNRKKQANAIVLHPTRAAWLASNLSSTFPLFQLGVLQQAAGTQTAGFVDNFAGLKTIIDSNIVFDYGASTDQDEIYVVRLDDLYLLEGPQRFRVFPDVLSGTLQVRLQVVGFSAFISGRQPTAITIISGTGLKGATF